MTYVINEPCIGTKDTSCVDVFPVDCIHPTPDEPGFHAAEQLYIDPDRLRRSTVTVAAFGTETERRYRIVGMHERHQPNDVSAGSPLGRRWWADGGGIQRRSRFRAGKNGVFGSSPVPS